MNIKTQERILLWLPVVIWFGLISLLSSIPATTLSLIAPSSCQFWGHRIAHIVEYGVLGVLVMRAYANEKAKITVVTILFLACFIFLSGVLDEWHQSFTPGRTPELIDAIFDAICGTFGMLIYKMFVLNKHYVNLKR
jgi:VanZ family protein